VTINGGEIKLAAFSEVRQLIISNFLSADWYGAWFTDMGNVWYGPETNIEGDVSQNILKEGKFHFNDFYKQIAVGSGLGVRLDWDFVILRLDFSTRVHDLDEGWFKDDNIYFSFGIGHSF
jgi:outer membrane protein assembly factor BamA